MGCGPLYHLGGGIPGKGAHIRTIHPQPDTIEGVLVMSEFFEGRAHFSASLRLFAFVNNVSLIKPSLDLACLGGGGFTPWMTRQGTV